MSYNKRTNSTTFSVHSTGMLCTSLMCSSHTLVDCHSLRVHVRKTSWFKCCNESWHDNLSDTNHLRQAMVKNTCSTTFVTITNEVSNILPFIQTQLVSSAKPRQFSVAHTETVRQHWTSAVKPSDSTGHRQWNRQTALDISSETVRQHWTSAVKRSDSTGHEQWNGQTALDMSSETVRQHWTWAVKPSDSTGYEQWNRQTALDMSSETVRQHWIWAVKPSDSTGHEQWNRQTALDMSSETVRQHWIWAVKPSDSTGHEQ